MNYLTLFVRKTAMWVKELRECFSF